MQVIPDREDANLEYWLLNLGFGTVPAATYLRLCGSRTSTRHTYTRLAKLHAGGYLTRLPRYTSPAISSGSLHDLLTVESGRAGVQADAQKFFEDMTPSEASRWRDLARADSERIRNLLATHGFDPDRVEKRLRQNGETADKVLRSVWNTTEHAVLTTNLVSIMAYAGVACGLSIHDIRGDKQLDLSATETAEGGKTTRHVRTPDALLVLEEEGMLDVFIIEAETGTASRKKVKDKLATYLAILACSGGYDEFRVLVARAADLDPNAVRSVRIVVYSQTDAHHKMVGDVLAELSPDRKVGMFYLVPASIVNLDISADILRKNKEIPGLGVRPTEYYRTLLHGDVAEVIYGQIKENEGTDEKPVWKYYPDRRTGPLFYYKIPGLPAGDDDSDTTE